MTNLLFRIRIAVLWVAVAVAVSYSVVMYMLGPGALEEMLGGYMEGDPLDSFGIQGFTTGVLLVPLAMAAVTLLVADRFNRYLNLALGGIFGLLGAAAATVESLDGGVTGHVVLVATAAVLAFLIAGLAALDLRHPAGPPTSSVEATTRDRTGAAP